VLRSQDIYLSVDSDKSTYIKTVLDNGGAQEENGLKIQREATIVPKEFDSERDIPQL
jgi:hypothetical protein